MNSIINTKTRLSYFIKTYGCQMNVNDSEIIAGQMDKMGYQMTSQINQADIIVLNTCCVREKVEHKIYSMAGIVKQIKEENPDLIFGICGCLAQKEQENIKKRIPSVDIIFGPSQSTSFQNILEKFLLNKKRKVVIDCDNRKSFQLKDILIKHQHPISAYVQIMKGCNNFCSYCIVPYTRGPEESRKGEEILNEIRKLVTNGYKEIFLLGQNVNSYGQTMQNNDNFITLLSKINQIAGIERIRFTTSHPKDFNLDLIKVIKNGEKICEHIHLPIQSGSDKILKRMNRKYDRHHYYSIVNYIKKEIPGASITTDAMVGFPGETEEDFKDTLNTFQEIQFDSAYTFIYSNREKTLSSLFDEQISLPVKKKRLWRLMELQKEISIKKNKALIGQTIEVLVEDQSKKGIQYQYWGKTRTNKVVVFSNKNKKRNKAIGMGQLVYTKIQEADTYTLYGEFVDAESK